MTVLETLAVAAGALLVGAVLGYVLTRTHRRRSQPGKQGPTVAELLMRFVRTSNSGIVVLGAFGEVVVHNTRAVELGLVHYDEVDARARQAAERATETGDRLDIDLSPTQARGRQPEAVHGEVIALGDGFTVIEALDHSEAVRLEATRRDFVANVSHELKTPVGAMALLSEAVVDAAENPGEVRRFGGKLLHESTRLGALVTELIALSRLQGAEKPPDPTVVDVDGVVNEALNRARPAAEAEESPITADSDSGLLVQGDRTLLVTALANLLANAVAYSPAGSAVSVSRRFAGGMVEIAVTDRGFGIGEDDQQRVFERFYRVDQARSRVTGGTGLGLAIVKHVAANHGGEVRLWSKLGTGSTFTLCIPAHDPHGGHGSGEVSGSDDLAQATETPAERHQRHAESGAATGTEDPR